MTDRIQSTMHLKFAQLGFEPLDHQIMNGTFLVTETLTLTTEPSETLQGPRYFFLEKDLKGMRLYILLRNGFIKKKLPSQL